LQRRLLLTLGDHHDRNAGICRPDLLQHIGSGPPRHLLVEQDEIVALTAQLAERVVTVGYGIDLVAPLFEDETMG
jgi:hypothetical protein